MEPRKIWAIAGTILLSGIFFFFQSNYLMQYLTDWLGLLLLPFMANPGSVKKRWFYLFFAVFFLFWGGGSYQIFYYGSFVCFLLFWWESLGFRFNWLPLFLLAVIAPLTRQLVFLWSFPIRLELSHYAGKALRLIGMTVDVSGNSVFLNGAEFSVDAACTGLKMISIAWVFGLFILAFYEKKHNRRFNFLSVVIFLIGVLFLTVFANFTRLLALIIFHIPPENIMHDGIGLAALFVYVLLPAFFIGKYFIRYFGKKYIVEKDISESNFTILKTGGILSCLIVALVVNGFFLQNRKITIDPDFAKIELPTYQKSILENGIIKFEKPNLLVYIKPPAVSFGMPHDPRYCWQGDGWEFKRIRSVQIENISVFFAEMQKEGISLKTMWWYENGKHRTIKESEWRRQTLLGNGTYRLINVTSSNMKTLEEEVKQLYKKENILE